jgi:hypothetical protein
MRINPTFPRFMVLAGALFLCAAAVGAADATPGAPPTPSAAPTPHAAGPNAGLVPTGNAPILGSTALPPAPPAERRDHGRDGDGDRHADWRDRRDDARDRDRDRDGNDGDCGDQQQGGGSGLNQGAAGHGGTPLWMAH